MLDPTQYTLSQGDLELNQMGELVRTEYLKSKISNLQEQINELGGGNVVQQVVFVTPQDGTSSVSFETGGGILSATGSGSLDISTPFPMYEYDLSQSEWAANAIAVQNSYNKNLWTLFFNTKHYDNTKYNFEFYADFVVQLDNEAGTMTQVYSRAFAVPRLDDTLRSSTTTFGNKVSTRDNGNTRIYFGDGNSTGWTVPANTWTYLATTTDFPEIAGYLGNPIYKTANIFTSGGSVFSASLTVRLDNTGIAVNTNASGGQLIGAGNEISFEFPVNL